MFFIAEILDPKKLVSYPGFNVEIDKDTKDVSFVNYQVETSPFRETGVSVSGDGYQIPYI